MSDQKRPARRRRIAGETSAASRPVARPGRRVVKKPVARPGGRTPSEQPDVEPAIETPEQVQPRIVPAGRRSRRAVETAEPTESRAESGATNDVNDDSAASRLDLSQTTDPVEGRGRRARVATTVVAVLAVAVALAASLWAFGQIRGDTAVTAAHADAADAAAEAAEVILSYRYDQLDTHLEAAQARMTPSYAEDFESISPALDDLAPQRQIVVEATARDAAAVPCGEECTADRADVLVFIDQARLADGEDQPTVFGNRITLTMVERDGDWLVDDIEAF